MDLIISKITGKGTNGGKSRFRGFCTSKSNLTTIVAVPDLTID